MKRVFVLCLTLLTLSAVPSFAQTATPLSKFAWDQGGADAATAQAYTYKYYMDGATLGVAFTGVTCSGSTTVICLVPILPLTPGAHNVRITAENIAGVSSFSNTLQFNLVITPIAPSNLRLVILLNEQGQAIAIQRL